MIWAWEDAEWTLRQTCFWNNVLKTTNFACKGYETLILAASWHLRQYLVPGHNRRSRSSIWNSSNIFWECYYALKHFLSFKIALRWFSNTQFQKKVLHNDSLPPFYVAEMFEQTYVENVLEWVILYLIKFCALLLPIPRHIFFNQHGFIILTPDFFSANHFFLSRRPLHWYETCKASGTGSGNTVNCLFDDLFCIPYVSHGTLASLHKGDGFWRNLHGSDFTLLTRKCFSHYCRKHFRQTSKNWKCVQCPRSRELSSYIQSADHPWQPWQWCLESLRFEAPH